MSDELPVGLVEYVARRLAATTVWVGNPRAGDDSRGVSVPSPGADSPARTTAATGGHPRRGTSLTWREVTAEVLAIAAPLIAAKAAADERNAMRGNVHMPEVVRGGDGTWNVYCSACSFAAADYVYPCRVQPGSDRWPPAVLAARADGVRAEIAAVIDAQPRRYRLAGQSESHNPYAEGWDDAMDHAAQIARGGTR